MTTRKPGHPLPHARATALACAFAWLALAPVVADAAPEGQKYDYGTRASLAWEAGFTGQGQSIAIIDTGVAAAHPWFRGQVVGEACWSPPAIQTPGMTPTCPGSEGGPLAPGPQYGPGAALPPSAPSNGAHGTSVAGIAAGANVFTDGSLGNRGIAPDAGIVAVNAGSIWEKTGQIKFSDVSLAVSLAWVNAHLDEYNVAAVNLSLAGPGIVTNRHCTTSDLTPGQRGAREQIDKIVANGVPVVAAAGNMSTAGTLKDLVDVSTGPRDSLGFPACLSNVISVGATDPLQGRIAAVSKSSSAIAVMAPGMRIWMPFAASWSPTGIKMGEGTSMAAPMVSAAIALYRQQHPTATVAAVTRALQTTGPSIKLRRGLYKRGLNVADLLGVVPDEPAGAVNQKCFSIKFEKTGTNMRRGFVQLTCAPLKDQSGLLVVSVDRPDDDSLETPAQPTPYGPVGYFKTAKPLFGPPPFRVAKGSYKVCYQFYTSDDPEWPAKNGDDCASFSV